MFNPELITTADAAQLLGVQVRTVTRWAKAGRLAPAKKLPGVRGAYLFDQAEVENHIPSPERQSA